MLLCFSIGWLVNGWVGWLADCQVGLSVGGLVLQWVGLDQLVGLSLA